MLWLQTLNVVGMQPAARWTGKALEFGPLRQDVLAWRECLRRKPAVVVGK